MLQMTKFLLKDLPTVTAELLDDADEEFYRCVILNHEHVLQPYLPKVKAFQSATISGKGPHNNSLLPKTVHLLTETF